MAQPNTATGTTRPTDSGDAVRFAGLEALTCEVFAPHVSGKFSADLNSAIVSPSLQPRFDLLDKSRPVELELVEVTRYPNIKSRVGPKGREPFSLLFRGPQQQPLVSAIYTVSHSGLGETNLFLNPVQVSTDCRPGENPDGQYYESCFT